MSTKKWCTCLLSFWLVLLLVVSLLTGIIDPFFHYHAPLDSLAYPIHNQRYQNDGIVRHFSYDALITGTSMTENFKTSEFDALFDTTSIKVSYSGGSFDEIVTNLQKALKLNSGIRYVVFGIEEWFLYSERSLIQANGKYPTYLYDNNPFNDVNYLLNKDVLCNNTIGVLNYTRNGFQTTTFDAYSSWNPPTGKDVILANYQRPEPVTTVSTFTSGLAEVLRTNLVQTLLSLAQEYHNTEFLLFFPPYSVLYLDRYHLEGTFDMNIDAMMYASELLTQAENIRLFSFYTDYYTCTNLDHYRDIGHYDSSINSLILQYMHRDEYRLTPENYQAHWDEVRDFYSNYDYDAIFAE